MEKLWYEIKPYLYLIVSAYALWAGKGSALMTLSGVMIGFCGVSVAMLRYDNRQLANGKKSSSKRDPELRTHHSGQTSYRID